MPNYSEPRCTECGKLTSEILLTIKRVVFAEQTRPGKGIKQRTVAKLCEPCLKADPDWQRPAYGGPNNTSAPLERARRAGHAD